MNKVARCEFGMDASQQTRQCYVLRFERPDLASGALDQAEDIVPSVKKSPSHEDMKDLLKDLHRGDQLRPLPRTAVKHAQGFLAQWVRRPRCKQKDV